jgi:hypothetical protein
MSKKRSREEISAIVSGAGLLTSFWTELEKAVRKLGGSDEDIYRLIKPEGGKIIEQIATLIVEDAKTGIYTVVVNYDQNIKEMIKAGNYDWENYDINDKNFPVVGVGQEEHKLVLVHLDKAVTTKEALEEIGRRGLLPAKLEHLLAFGAKYPEKQREFPIVELGSGWVNPDGSRHVAFLFEVVGRRGLRLRWGDPGDQWGGHSRFLAVSK